jgi:hypothetical protein
MTLAHLPPLDDVPAERFASPVLVDLRTAWSLERELATAPGAWHDRWCRRNHGWLLDTGLDGPLEPLLVTDSLGAISFYRFTLLDGDAASRLLDLLDEEYLARERQNDGPTIGAVLRAVAAHSDGLLAHGYVVGPGRCDERLTVEGVLVRTDRPVDVATDDGRAALLDHVRACGIDDMRVPPHEIAPWWGFAFGSDDGGGDEHWYRLWWD